MGGSSSTLIYRSDHDPAYPYDSHQRIFTNINVALESCFDGSVAWGDYDNDGYLDILIARSGIVSVIYHNEQDPAFPFDPTKRIFTDIGARLAGLFYARGVWGDYDNDGYLDILMTGYGTYGAKSMIYHNNANGRFSLINPINNSPLQWLCGGGIAWGDYNNDGCLDIFLNGVYASYGGFVYKTMVYCRSGNTFSIFNGNLTGMTFGSAATGDYDNDGDLDIYVTGRTAPSVYTYRLYRNDNSGVFTNVGTGFVGVESSSNAWGDYDNDGNLDMLLTGKKINGQPLSYVYHNNGNGTFTKNTNITLPPVLGSSVAWGDYNNDGRLDILMTGSGITRIYRNQGSVMNTPPLAPSILTSNISGNSVTLSWSQGSDAQTPSSGLSYNIWIGTSPASVDKLSPMANINGWRRIPARGPVQNMATTINNLSSGTYYWSVQSIDTAFAGSPFAPTQSFTIP